jgi:hypothetical protein
MCIGASRVELHGLGKLFYRFRELIHLREYFAYFVMGHRLIGLNGQRLSEFIQCFPLESLPKLLYAL